MATKDEYRAAAQRLKASLNNELDNSLKYSAESDSNRWANIDALNRKTGVPHDTIERNFTRVSADNKYRNVDVQKLFGDSPKTAEWLSNPYNARQAYDDIEKLSNQGS